MRRDDSREAESVDEILRLVAEGRLSPQEADRLLAELDRAPRSGEWASGFDRRGERSGRLWRDEPMRHARIEVTERGRSVVNMRVPIAPISLGRYALSHVPGLSENDVARITDSIERGLSGRILEVQDDDGDGVRIIVE
jgi:hypothetical protein